MRQEKKIEGHPRKGFLAFLKSESERQRQNKDSQALTPDKMKNLSYSRLLSESFYLNLQKSAFYKYL